MLATTKEVAAALHVHPQTIRRMVARKQIPPQYIAKVGSNYRYNLPAIEKYLLQKEPTAPEASKPGAANLVTLAQVD